MTKRRPRPDDHSLASVRQRKYATIRQYAMALLLVEAGHDDDGRRVGLDYITIYELIKKKFPIVTYSGPHKGQPMRMTYKQLRWIATEMNRDGVVLPVRPRRRNKSKVKS
jgi:hypothetical protein